MKRSTNLILMFIYGFILMMFISGCSGTYYSRKKIPIKISNAQAKLYGEIEGLEFMLDIERCKSDGDECYKILNAIHNGSVNVEGVNWDNFEIIIKEK